MLFSVLNINLNIFLLRFIAGSKIKKAQISNLSNLSQGSPIDENISINLQFEDGSQGTVHYFANGHKSFPKERLEIFTEGKVLQLDNFRKLKGYGFNKFKKMNLWRQDKGQKNCAKAFVQSIQSGSDSPILFEEIIEIAQICIELKGRLG